MPLKRVLFKKLENIKTFHVTMVLHYKSFWDSGLFLHLYPINSSQTLQNFILLFIITMFEKVNLSKHTPGQHIYFQDMELFGVM